MITRFYADNYKCLVNFELKLREVTLLFGPHGSGKSSVLDVLFALRQLLTGVVKVHDGGIFPGSTLTRWQDHRTQIFELDLVLKGETYTYRLEVEHDAGGRRARVHLEQLRVEGKPLFLFKEGEVQP